MANRLAMGGRDGGCLLIAVVLRVREAGRRLVHAHTRPGKSQAFCAGGRSQESKAAGD